MKQHRKRIRSMALVAAFCLLFSSLGFLPSSADRGYPTPSSVVINGKTVPLQIDKYRPGEYYTGDGKACTDHYKNECSFSGGCNCKFYEPPLSSNFPCGIQCYAFALDVYKRVFGYDVSEVREDEVHWSCANTDGFKANMQSIPAGSMVRLVTRKDTSVAHAVILMKATAGEVWVYQCNVENTCEVTAQIYTYAQFASRFYEVWYYVPPCTHTRTYTYTTTQHTSSCSLCGFSNVTDGHTYIPQANGRSRCCCGRWAETGGGIVRIDDEQEI